MQRIVTSNEYGEAEGLPKDLTTMHVLIHEDNAGALILAGTLPPCHTPQSKHYAIETILFCEEIAKRGRKIVKIDAIEQLVDMFTKAFPKINFEHLRSKVMGL